MKIERHPVLPDILLVTPAPFSDHRGYFMETHRAKDFPGIEFVQGNISESVPWTLRGLHYQLRDPQGKLVRCLRGAIYDVAVDMRESSPTLGRWIGINLNDENRQAVWVPPGFAHGFLSGPKGALVQYECSSYYVDDVNRSLAWNDPDLNINWPIDRGHNPNMSNKDRAAPRFAACERVKL